MHITQPLRRASIAWSLAMCFLSGLGADALAQNANYPNKTVRFVNNFPPGGPSDILARSMAEALQTSLKQTFIVENKAGAGGMIAGESVAKSEPDGYTLFMASGNATMASNPHLFKKLPFDPVKDFAPVATLYQIGRAHV